MDADNVINDYTHSIVLMGGSGRREGLKRCGPSGTMMGRMRISMRMWMRRSMWVTRVRGRRCPLIEVRIILIHHLGAAHHTPRTRHPRAGLPTCVTERCTRVTRALYLLHSRYYLFYYFFFFYYLFRYLLLIK